MDRHILAAITALVVTGVPAAERLHAQAVVEGDGASALGVALRRLGTTKRVLMIAAHPDDENTAVLAELALGDGADVAYLSLTRGEGGQNLIGPELQEGLGLIRTEELLAARRLDGARQFFSRAYDYGFSKSATEAFSQWPRDTLLADAVEVIRRYRPDIIISVFGGTPADGHGQHQAAGVIAREAFDAAADPARFPAQLRRGLTPHRARYLYQAQYRPGPEARMRLSTGDYDPLFGRSRYQIAMQSRSRHRSQDMGRAEPIGPQATSLVLLAGDHPAAGAGSLFASLDTTLAQHARRAGIGAGRITALARYEQTVLALRDAYNPLRTHQLVAPLSDALARLRDIAANTNDAAFARTLHDEIGDIATALRLAAGVVIDIVADSPQPVPGESFRMTITVWNGGRDAIELHGVTPVLPDGWTYTAASSASEAGNDGSGTQRLGPNDVARSVHTVHVPRDAEPTEAYFLRTPRRGALYEWSVADSVRALPFATPPVRALIDLRIGPHEDAIVRVEREAVHVDVDKAVGELRTPLLVVPRVGVAVEPRTLAIPAGETGARDITVAVTTPATGGVSGTLHLEGPAGWRIEPAARNLSLERAGDRRTVVFRVTPPVGATGVHPLRAWFETDGEVFDRGFNLIRYPHIRPQPLYRTAEVRVSMFPVRIAENLRIGWIEGAGDDAADALRQLGAVVEPLDAAALSDGDLSDYDAIVAGIRAYEVRTDLIANNDRLLDYVRGGGTFVVQYNKYELVEDGFMPYPATMSRPHGRVTDHAAAVTLLDASHPLLTTPNRITAADFEGWVQERGLYFLAGRDDRYSPLLAMADPGEAPLDGALVAARVGQGWYIYTGLALFRQWPDGVPGAYRLLANMVSLGR